MSKVNISIVIPAYNAEGTIASCLDHLLKSDYPRTKYEIIVVDNGSTDSTQEIIKKYPVKLINCSPPNRSLARNVGWKNAHGDLIAFVDADCRVNSDWLKEMVNAFDYEWIGAAQGKIMPGIQKNLKIKKIRDINYFNTTFGTYILLENYKSSIPLIDTAACVYRKKALELISGFDQNLKRQEDLDLSYRTYLSGYVLKSVPSAVSYVDDETKTIFGFLWRSFESGYYFHKLHMKIFGKQIDWKSKTKIKDFSSYKKSEKKIELLLRLGDFFHFLGILISIFLRKKVEASKSNNAKLLYNGFFIDTNKTKWKIKSDVRFIMGSEDIFLKKIDADLLVVLKAQFSELWKIIVSNQLDEIHKYALRTNRELIISRNLKELVAILSEHDIIKRI